MNVIRFLKLPALSQVLSSIFPTEAIMLLLYSLTWIFPAFMTRLDGGIVNSLTWGLFLQLLFGHSAVGITLARLFAKKQVMRAIAVSAAGIFYLLFIAAFAISTRSYLLIPIFLISLASAFREPEDRGDIILNGVVYPFITVMILVLTSGPGMLISAPKLGFSKMPMDIKSRWEDELISEPQNIMLWGILYFTLLWLLRIFWDKRVMSQNKWKESILEKFHL